jgi:hypothetical protein
MADLIETTRWRSDRIASEGDATPIDPATARELAAAKLEQRAALAVDRQSAMIEYEAKRFAVIANTERLKSLREARDAAAALDATSQASEGKKSAATVTRPRKTPAKLA